MVENVAAEPDVVSPVAIAWDADLRLFVAEMVDYPVGPKAGRIRLLEDRDGDGRYERSTIFADQLAFPNSVLPWNDGVLVTAAPDLWYLKDTDGDGRADERRVLFTGFGEGNQQLRANGLMWGLDNWIYGANGRSDGEVRRPGVSDSPISLRGHDFRFRPDTLAFETLAGRSQFGLAHDDWGHRFLSWNTIPIRHEVFPERYLSRTPHLPAAEVTHNLLPPDDDGQVFPLTPTPLTFNSESTRHFNALAGLTIYRGDALPESYRGNAFLGETLRNLVHRRVLEPQEVTFTARRGEPGREFLASSDPWFHPVNFATGPDGALYMVDFYRQWVEHPAYVPERLRGPIAWRTGAEHGRLWRVFERSSKSRIQVSRPVPSRATVAELIALLESPNGWWRDTAQRLLVERKDSRTVEPLRRLARESRYPVARLHALFTLDGLAALSDDLLHAARSDPHPRVREGALRLSEARFAYTGPATPLAWEMLELASDPDPRVRLQLALSAGALGMAGHYTLAKLAARPDLDRWSSLAILSGLGTRPIDFLRAAKLHDSAWLQETNELKLRLLGQVTELVAATEAATELSQLLDDREGDASRTRAARLVGWSGCAEGLKRAKRSLGDLLRNSPTNDGKPSSLRALLDEAALAARERNGSLITRRSAVRLLGHGEAALEGSVLMGLLSESLEPETHRAAVTSLTELRDTGLLQRLLEHWPRMNSRVRRETLRTLVNTEPGTEAVIEGLEQKQVSPLELDPADRERLRQSSRPTWRSRALHVLGEKVDADRAKVIARFEPVLGRSGDRRLGAALFSRHCLTCHTIQGRGQAVGPDLSGIGARPAAALLVDILDPSRDVAPDFLAYEVVKANEETQVGLLVNDTLERLTLRRSGLPDVAIDRRDIQTLRASGKSLMPDGLEQGFTEEDLANLLAFLRQPEKGLLPSGE